MKKTISILMLGIAVMLASCSQDDSVDLQNSENNRVMISANLGDETETLLKSGAQTRATGDLQLTGYSLRYILEVWNENDAVAYREERLVCDASQTVTFDFNLPVAGNYDALLWADYVTTGVTATDGHYPDLYYTTNDTDDGLKAVSIITDDYGFSADSRDAFFGKMPLIKKDGEPLESGSVTLGRPFGRINIIEKDAVLLAELASITLSYNVPGSFNVMDGEPIESMTVNASVSNMTSFPDADIDKANLFFDYIFAPSSEQELMGEIQINYTLANNVTGTFVIPANMPVERNKRTNISGNILTDNSSGAKLSVEIDNVWTEPDIVSNTTASVGDYYYEGGWFYEDYIPSMTCLGVVFYTENDGRNGKVIGLQERSSVSWGESITTSATDMSNGLANMATIYALSNDFTDYPAFKWIHDDMNGGGTANYYSDATAKGVWYLPAKDELSALHAAYNVDRTAFNNKLTAAGGTALGSDYFYWSSSEEDEINTWAILFFASGSANMAYVMKFADSDDHKARCILAF